MASLSGQERALLEAVSGLAFCNPFLPERTGWERAALGPDYIESDAVWSFSVEDPDRPRVNVWRIAERLQPLAEQIRQRLIDRVPFSERELALYQDAILQLLYQRFYSNFYEGTFGRSRGERRWHFYGEFASAWRHFFDIPAVFPAQAEPRHIFSCFHQIQRAFNQIFNDIIGGSMAAARLRASVWQSVFTHDMRRYQRTLYARMQEFATLITGPSGTGKELAARAIARSRYLPFDEAMLTFPGEKTELFYPINISALSPTLVESELFGHRKGSFTGAVADRKGWLEACPEAGAVFLDELGDLEPSIQVKLLRVIETRSFHPVGGSASLQFRGKLIAATNRDLAARTAKGEFREDLYYRLCSDQIVTPTLREQVAESPQVLEELIGYMARRVAGAEAESLARDASGWIQKNLGQDYTWPGNYRELEQCIKNVLIRRDYRPLRGQDQGAARTPVAGLTAEELVAQYCATVYRHTGSYEETARRVGLDRRTVKSKVDRILPGGEL